MTTVDLLLLLLRPSNELNLPFLVAPPNSQPPAPLTTPSASAKSTNSCCFSLQAPDPSSILPSAAAPPRHEDLALHYDELRRRWAGRRRLHGGAKRGRGAMRVCGGCHTSLSPADRIQRRLREARLHTRAERDGGGGGTRLRWEAAAAARGRCLRWEE